MPQRHVNAQLPLDVAPLARPANPPPRIMVPEYTPEAPGGFSGELTAPGLAAEPMPTNVAPWAPRHLPQGADILRAALDLAIKDRSATTAPKRLMALTLAGPWGYAVDQLGKRIENRSRPLFRLRDEPFKIVLLHVGSDAWGRAAMPYATNMASLSGMGWMARNAQSALIHPYREGEGIGRVTLNGWRWSEQAPPEFAVSVQRLTAFLAQVNALRAAMNVGQRSVQALDMQSMLTPPTGVPSSAIVGVMAVYTVGLIRPMKCTPWGVPGAVGHVFTYAPLASPVRGVQGAQGLWSASKTLGERQDELIGAIEHSIEQDRWSRALLSNNSEGRGVSEWRRPTEAALQTAWQSIDSTFDEHDPDDCD